MTKYYGNYDYNRLSINLIASDNNGVYYCGTLNNSGSLVPYYIGRAAGTEVSIKKRLNDHLAENWGDVTHFGYVICESVAEAIALEEIEIKKFQPKYNVIGK